MSSNPVKWRENEQLISKLYNHSYDIFNKRVTEEFDDPNGDATDSQMIRDFNGLLDYLGALQIRQERSESIRGLQVSIRKYVYSGYIPTEPPEHLSEATEFERRYMYNFKLFLNYARAIVCAFKIAEGNEESNIPSFAENPSYLIKELSQIGYNIQGTYEHNRKIYEKIFETKELYPNRREDIEKKTRDIENNTQSMLNQLPIIISKMIISLNPEINIQQRRIEKNNDIFDIIPNEYRSYFLDGQVIVNPDLSRQMLLINKKMPFVRTIEAELIKYEATHKVVYISRIQGNNQAKYLCAISAVSPKELKESMIPFLVGIKKFFKSQEE